MNSKIICFLMFFYAPFSLAEAGLHNWYVGVLYGTAASDDENSYEPEQIPGEKYGLFGGYQINTRIAIEAGYAQHKSTSETFCGVNSIQCVSWTKDYKYSFAGIKITLFQGKHLSGSLKLAALFGAYESNIDSKKFTSFNPGFALNWHIKEDFSVSIGAEYPKYEVGFNQTRYAHQFNLSLVMGF